MTLDIERLLQIPEGEKLIGIDEWKKFWRERARNKRDGYPAVAGLDQWHPGWWLRTQAELRWVSMALAVGEFYRETSDWPRQKGVPEDEGELGAWLSHQRQAKKNGNWGWSPERQIYLDEVAPGWEGIGREAEWREKADAVGEFRRKTGGWPRVRAKGVPEDEGELGAWLGIQRQAKRGKGTRTLWTPERQAYLDEVAPGWEGADREAEWRAKADVVGRFYRETSDWPRRKGKGVPEDEGKLGIWLSDQRRAKKNGNKGWSPDRQAYLDEVAPGWDGADREAAWREKADAVGAFYRNAGDWPSVEGKNLLPDEKKLGNWLRDQRKAKKNGNGGWSPERQIYLDEVAPGWEGADREAQWRKKADAVGAFYRENDRWPRMKRKGVPENEGELGKWLSRQRQAKKNGNRGWSPERQAYLDEVAPRWDTPICRRVS